MEGSDRGGELLVAPFLRCVLSRAQEVALVHKREKSAEVSVVVSVQLIVERCCEVVA